MRRIDPGSQDEAALLRRVADDRVRLLRFLYCDPSGVIHGKQVHAARLAGTVQAGLGLTRAQNAVNLLDELVAVTDREPVGEVRIVPDPGTYVRLPWLDGVGSVLSDQVDHAGRDWGCCPRAFLRRAVTRAAHAGIRVLASFAPRPFPDAIGSGATLLTRCILATRRAEYDRCVQLDDDAVRRATFTIFPRLWLWHIGGSGDLCGSPGSDRLCANGSSVCVIQITVMTMMALCRIIPAS